MKRVVALASLLTVAAIMFVIVGCGSDSTTEPQNAQVGGLWSYNTGQLSGGLAGLGVRCFITNVDLSLNQTGATFTGNANGGHIRCTVAGVTVMDGPLGNQVVVNGTVSGNNLSFDIETPAWHHIGSVSGNSMSGTVRFTIDLGGTTGSVDLTCNWSAIRSAAQTAQRALASSTRRSTGCEATTRVP